MMMMVSILIGEGDNDDDDDQSILIGHNDLCLKSCKGFLNRWIPRTRVSARDYETNVRKGENVSSVSFINHIFRVQF